MNKNKKPRCGSKFYNGIEIPETTKIFTSQLGREFRIYCNLKNKIQFLDTGEIVIISSNQMNKILC